MSLLNVDTPTTSNPPPVILTPDLAVIRPTESIFSTSSYVRVPAILTLPRKVAIPTTSKFSLTSKLLSTYKPLI